MGVDSFSEHSNSSYDISVKEPDVMSLLVALATLPTKNFSMAVCAHAPMQYQ